MPVNYESRRSAPLNTNGYVGVISLLREYNLEVFERDRSKKWGLDGDASPKWRNYTHAQIHDDGIHIGDIVGVSVLALVVYDGFPEEAIEAILKGGYLKRELTIPKSEPIETDIGFS